MKEGRSLIKGERYFLSDIHNFSLYRELETTIKYFQEDKVNKDGILYQCQFPARFYLLNQRWPQLFTKRKCSELNNWISALAAKDIYLVFTTAYPSNPASILGHTFFRVSRKRGEDAETQNLLGYSFAYQAQTNPDDSALMYTYKGVTGGYYAHLQIKPFYMDIGIYNNSESRDTWEWNLKLTEEEKYIFLLHSWELSTSAAFTYLFHKENCSTFLLRHLEVVRTSYSSKVKDHYVVIPQDAVKEITSSFKLNTSQYRASIKKRIRVQLKALTSRQEKELIKAKNNPKKIRELNDPILLDPLIDYWKWRKYQDILAKEESKVLLSALQTRASLKLTSSRVEITTPSHENPKLIHPFNRIILKQGKNSTFKLRLGFHSFDDFNQGQDNESYIQVGELEYNNRDNDHYFNFNIVDLLSIPQKDLILNTFAFRFKMDYIDNSGHKSLNTLMGFGDSSHFQTDQIFYLLVLKYFGGRKITRPGINLGFKKYFTIGKRDLALVAQTLTLADEEKLNTDSSLKLLNYYQSTAWFIEYSKNTINLGQIALGVNYYF